MNTDTPEVPRRRVVNLSKLRLPYEKGDDPLTAPEIDSLAHQGVIRSMHYLLLAERYMMDLSELGGTRDLEDQIEALSGVSAYMQRMASKMIRPR